LSAVLRFNADIAELAKKFADLTVRMNELEKNMTLTAKSRYGKAVGGDGFNYLLLVFAGVFLVIMIISKFYPPSVAEMFSGRNFSCSSPRCSCWSQLS
jgi:hypothetical protein